MCGFQYIMQTHVCSPEIHIVSFVSHESALTEGCLLAGAASKE